MSILFPFLLPTHTHNLIKIIKENSFLGRLEMSASKNESARCKIDMYFLYSLLNVPIDPRGVSFAFVVNL